MGNKIDKPTLGLIALMGIAGIVKLGTNYTWENNYNRSVEQHLEKYGTAENPSYTPKEKTINLITPLSKQEKNEKSLKEKLENIEKIYKEEDISKDQTKNLMQGSSRIFDIIKNSRNIYELDSTQIKESIPKNPEKKAKCLFEKITGKEWEGKKIEYTYPRKSNSIGSYTFTNDHIKVNPNLSNLEKLSTIMHEMGHAITRHPNKWENRRTGKKSEIMREAKAYLFEFMAPYYCEDSQLRKNYIDINNERIASNSNAEINKSMDEVHYQSMGTFIAYSALKHFKNTKEAYEHLTTTKYNNLKPKIIEGAKEYKNMIEQLGFIEEAKKAVNLMDSLKNKK